MTIPYGAIGGELDKQEWELMMERRRELLAEFDRRMDTQQQTGLPAATVDALHNRANQQAGKVPLVTQQGAADENELRNKLYGAARFWGIPEFEKRSLPELAQQIEVLRAGAHQGEGNLNPLEALAITGAGLFAGTGQGLLNMIKDRPFIGKILRERGVVEEASERINALKEAVAISVPLDKQAALPWMFETGKLGTEFLLYDQAFGMLGKVGALSSLPKGARAMNVLRRTAMRGAATELIVKGGADESYGETLKNAAEMGALAGGLHAAGMAAGPYVKKIADRLKRSFPEKPGAGIDTETGGIPDAEWEFAPNDGPTLPPGGGSSGVLPMPQRALPPGQPMLPAGLEAAPVEVQQAAARALSLREVPAQTIEPGQQWLMDRLGHTPESAENLWTKVLGDADKASFNQLAEANGVVGGTRTIPEVTKVLNYENPIDNFALERTGAHPSWMEPQDYQKLLQDWAELPVEQKALYEKTASTVKPTLVEHDTSVPGMHMLAFDTPQGRVGLNITVEGQRAEVHWFGSQDATTRIDIGASATKSIMEQTKALYPEVKTVLYERLRVDSEGQVDVEPKVRHIASNLTKQATVIESPTLLRKAGQEGFTTADVIEAAAESNPGGVAIITGVHDAPEVMHSLVQGRIAASGKALHPDQIALVEREVGEGVRRTDVLVSTTGRVTPEMTRDYGTHGVTRGQRVVAEGLEGQIQSFEGDRALVKFPGGTTRSYHPSELMPDKFTGHDAELIGVADADALYTEFQEGALGAFNEEARLAGMPVGKDWLSPEVSSMIPDYLDDYLKMKGITDPVTKAVVEAEFNLRRVADFQAAAPEDLIRMRQITAVEPTFMNPEARQISHERPNMDELAESRLMHWQRHPGQRSGILRDLQSGKVYPMEHEGAAEAFLQDFRREPMDLTPQSDVPMEIMELGPNAAHPGQTASSAISTESIVEGMQDYISEMEEDILSGASAPPPFDKGSSVLAFPQPSPHTPARSAPLPFAEPPSRGGPPIFPPSGGGLVPINPTPNKGPETLLQQFLRARKDRPVELVELINRMDGLFLQILKPVQATVLDMTPMLEKLGIDARSLWRDYDNISVGKTKGISETQPWAKEIGAINSNLPAQWLRDGTVTRIHEISDYNQKLAEMDRLGFTPEQRNAMKLREDWYDRFFQFMVNDPKLAMNPHKYIFNYISHVGLRQGMPGIEDPFMNPDVVGKLGPYDWFAKHARSGSLNMRQLNAEWLDQYMLRAAMFEKHIAPHWNAMNEAWSEPGMEKVAGNLQKFVLDWLGLIRNGYNGERQMAIHGVTQTLNSFGIPVTSRDVQKFYGLMFRNTYRAFLGWKPSAFFRDSIQPLFGWTRFGQGDVLGGVYGDFISNPALRRQMTNRALQEGWLAKGQVRASESEAFQPVMTPEGTELLSATMQARREEFQRLSDRVHDALPNSMKDGLQGWADPMHAYGEVLGNLNRIISGEYGWRMARNALSEFRAGKLDMAGLMKKSSARMQHPTIAKEFEQLVASGADADAAALIGRSVADTQFRYGLHENPPAIRTTAGRAGMMFGNFTTNYIQQMRMGLSGLGNLGAETGGGGGGIIPPEIGQAFQDFGGIQNPSATVGDAAAFAMRQAAIYGVIGAAAAYTGWKGLRKWMWDSSLAFSGGPGLQAAAEAMKVVGGTTAALTGAQVPYEMGRAAEKFFSDNPNQQPAIMAYNPFRGALDTSTGIENALGGPDPLSDLGRFIIAGEKSGSGSAAFRSWYDDLLRSGHGAPGSVANPSPMPQGVAPPNGVLELPGIQDRLGNPVEADTAGAHLSPPISRGGYGIPNESYGLTGQRGGRNGAPNAHLFALPPKAGGGAQ